MENIQWLKERSVGTRRNKEEEAGEKKKPWKQAARDGRMIRGE